MGLRCSILADRLGRNSREAVLSVEEVEGFGGRRSETHDALVPVLTETGARRFALASMSYGMTKKRAKEARQWAQ